ncbi:hypothetical protein GQ44DRAFT_736084 [Phaeosphaeriaceae sp. PMI808]|nr:hypothetical protein GQ44DRAFT_736084 [Phaeosphaeriaceae sp. PMI808]
MSLTRSAILCLVLAQYDGRRGGRGRYGPPDPNDDDGFGPGGFGPGGSGSGGFGPEGYSNNPSQLFIESRQKILIAHGVLASLAFVIFFPIGAILIRISSFPGVWLLHGIFQIFAYIVYIAAFAIGIWMVNNMPIDLITSYHPVIGIIVFSLLFFQPILGFVHHVKFRKHNRRTVWSYGHIWLGRIAITLGMINGGLGMLLASEAPGFLAFGPSRSQMIAYGVVAGIMWLLWVVAAVIGERRRRVQPVVAAKEVEVDDGTPPPYKERFAYVYRS